MIQIKALWSHEKTFIDLSQVFQARIKRVIIVKHAWEAIVWKVHVNDLDSMWSGFKGFKGFDSFKLATLQQYLPQYSRVISKSTVRPVSESMVICPYVTWAIYKWNTSYLSIYYIFLYFSDHMIQIKALWSNVKTLIDLSQVFQARIKRVIIAKHSWEAIIWKVHLNDLDYIWNYYSFQTIVCCL